WYRLRHRSRCLTVSGVLTSLEQCQEQQVSQPAVSAAEAAGLTQLLRGRLILSGAESGQRAGEHRLAERLGESPGLPLVDVESLPATARFVEVPCEELRPSQQGNGESRAGHRTRLRHGLQLRDGVGAATQSEQGARSEIAAFAGQVDVVGRGASG